MIVKRLKIALLLGICSVFVISPAVAEQFNDRGVLWATAAPAGSYAPRPPVRATLEEFNERGIDWVSAAPAGSYEPKPPVQARWEGWMRR